MRFWPSVFIERNVTVDIGRLCKRTNRRDWPTGTQESFRRMRYVPVRLGWHTRAEGVRNYAAIQKMLETKISGGETGIRTLETVSRLHTFQACAFDHSATSPARSL